MLDVNKTKSQILLISVVIAAVTAALSACSPGNSTAISGQNDPPYDLNLATRGQHPNPTGSIPITGGGVEDQSSNINQQEEQRLNDLASERWTGMAMQYQAANLNLPGYLQLNDISGERLKRPVTATPSALIHPDQPKHSGGR